MGLFDSKIATQAISEALASQRTILATQLTRIEQLSIECGKKDAQVALLEREVLNLKFEIENHQATHTKMLDDLRAANSLLSGPGDQGTSNEPGERKALQRPRQPAFRNSSFGGGHSRRYPEAEKA